MYFIAILVYNYGKRPIFVKFSFKVNLFWLKFQVNVNQKIVNKL